MELPKYHETFIPILSVLSKHWELHYSNLNQLVLENFYSNLPQDLLNLQTQSETNLLFDRIGRWKSYLKQWGFVDYPQRGMVKITEKGEKVFKKWVFTLQNLKNDPDFIKYREESKQKSSEKEERPFENSSSSENLSPQDMIDLGIWTIETQIKGELLWKLKSMNPYHFEKVILILLRKMGYWGFFWTPKSWDGGIDWIIHEDKLGLDKIYIQAKRFTENKVREIDIRNFIGAMSWDTNKGIFVTTSIFDDHAIDKAKTAHHKIILIDGEKLVNLMYQYWVGVQVRDVYEIGRASCRGRV